MGLTEGRQTLELVFEGGSVRKWYTHAGAYGRDELGRFDELAEQLIARG
jgi:hypothetical protein